jgi:uroporphyrinogen decarboxylase
MNSRERIFTVIKKRQPADSVPWTFNFGATQGFNPALLKRYKEHSGITGMIYDHFNYDVVNVLAPEKTGSGWLAGGAGLIANNIEPGKYYDVVKLPKNGFLDAWGIYNVPWETDPTFEYFINPLKKAMTLQEIENYPSPSVDVHSLDLVMREAGEIRESGRMSSSYSGSLYEWCWNLRGQEEFMIDLYENPEFVDALLEKVSELTQNLAVATVRAGVDVLAFYDDAGMQTALQISPAHWRKHIKPRWKKVWEAVKKKNGDAIIFLHSCGCIEEIIPDLIEIGLDVLHPIQPETMDVYRICAEYGRDLAFWGTVSSQRTIPFGSAADVEAEIELRVRKIGRKGGFILSPSNIMGPEVPFANIDAFAAAARKYCG